MTAVLSPPRRLAIGHAFTIHSEDRRRTETIVGVARAWQPRLLGAPPPGRHLATRPGSVPMVRPPRVG
jgi:hypothetical protein